MEPILKVEKLSVHFKNDQGLTSSVQQVSFDIKKGKICGIVGESGSGKSVSSLAIMGLLGSNAFIEGNITLQLLEEKIDLLTLSETEKIKLRGSKIAMVFQEHMTSLKPELT